VSKARELTRRSVESAIKADSKESGAIWQANEAVQQAAYGSSADAKQSAADAFEAGRLRARACSWKTALAYAMAGDAARAESMAQTLDKAHPLNTQIQSLWLPAIRAQLALNKKDPAGALSALEPVTSPLELGQISVPAEYFLHVSHVHSRGRRTWRRGKAKRPPRSFRKFSITAASCGVCWTGALARLGVARANALEAKSLQGADADAAPAREPSPPTKIFLRCGKTPTPASPSSSPPNPSTRSCNSNSTVFQ
jgi:hypothetical protein